MDNWVRKKYSKKEVRRAGKALAELESITPHQREVIGNWRAAHAFPLNSIQNSLRHRARKIDKDAVIAQRLKRLPSIKSKLQRFPTMSLDRMQDIGGCRAVVNDLKLLYLLRDELTLVSGVKERNDYVVNGKNDTGYRGIHLISKYSGKREEYSGFQSEIQIRTKVQHAWATAVEVIGSVTKQSLKTSQGDKDIIKYFKFVSDLFYEEEYSFYVGGIESRANQIKRQEVRNLTRELRILEKLSLFNFIDNFIVENEDKVNHYLLCLDIVNKKLDVQIFSTKEVEKATAVYTDIEEKNQDLDVVLVSARSANSIRKSYPNYFANTELFRDFLLKATKS